MEKCLHEEKMFGNNKKNLDNKLNLLEEDVDIYI